ncbi:MAG: spore germination protein [Clostridia bacterium]|nr:spore germination protein [Clostridia bacterium]
MEQYWLDAEQSIRYRAPVEQAPVSAARVQQYLAQSDDFIASKLSFGAVTAHIFCIDGLVKDSVVDENILSAFNEMPVFQKCKSEAQAVELIAQGYVNHAAVKKVGSLSAAIDAILSANFVMVFDKCRCAFVFDIKGFNSRSIEPPESESVIKGSKDGFTEPIRLNTAIVRRHIRSHHLVIKQFEIGTQSKTTVAAVYMQNMAKPELVQAVCRKIETCPVSAVVSLGQVEKALSSRQFALIPTVMHTERADKLCANILNGRIAVLTDGYPVGFIVPANLAMFLQAPEDYAAAPVYASFVRIIRYLCLAVNLLLPALYIAVANFSCEILPDKLAQSIMQAKFGMPFSTLTEVVLMLIAFEVLIESGLRLPNGVGQAVSIVSGLIVGDAAVSAKLASPAVVMLTAIAGITSFVLPYQSLANSLRVIRFGLVFAAAAGGLFALAVGVTLLIFYWNSIENFSLPFLAPFATGSVSTWLKDTFIRRQRSGKNT